MPQEIKKSYNPFKMWGWISIVVAVLVGSYFVLVYMNTNQEKQVKLDYANSEIQNAEVKYDISQAIYQMRAVASDETLPVDVRLRALKVLEPKVSTMSAEEKEKLDYQIIVSLSDQVNKFSQLSKIDQQRMIDEITILQGLLSR